MKSRMKILGIMTAFAVILTGFALICDNNTDAAPSATYNLTAQTGSYYEFDTNIPSNYAIPSSYAWAIAPALPQGMSLNAGGDIVGTPLMPGFYEITYYLNGVGSSANYNAGNCIKVNLTVTGEPTSAIATMISGSVPVTVNKNTAALGSYERSAQNFRVLQDLLPGYFGDASAEYDYKGVSGSTFYLEDYQREGAVSIKPVILNYSSVTYTTNTTLFTNLAYNSGTLSFNFNPTTYGIYAVGLWISAEGPGYDGGYEEFVCLNVYDYGVPINVSDQTVVCGQNLVMTPTASGYNVSVSGASWLSASGNVISGVAPSTPGVYTVTVTAGGSTATFTVTVVSKLVATNSPTSGAIVLPR